MADFSELIAYPGDPGLDCSLFDLSLRSVVSVDTDEFDLEATLIFDVSLTHGWWIDSRTGIKEDLGPSEVKEMQITFGIKMVDGKEFIATSLLKILVQWSESQVPIRMRLFLGYPFPGGY